MEVVEVCGREATVVGYTVGEGMNVGKMRVDDVLELKEESEDPQKNFIRKLRT